MTELPQTVTARPLLLVDDDATFVRVLARALSSRGFEVLTAANFDEASTRSPAGISRGHCARSQAR